MKAKQTLKFSGSYIHMINHFAQNTARCPIGSNSMSSIPMLGKQGLFGGKKKKNKKHNFQTLYLYI